MDLLIKVHLNDPSSMTLEDINDEVSTFMFEGHDTTSSAIEWALYCVARDRRIYKKIKDEINEELGI